MTNYTHPTNIYNSNRLFLKNHLQYPDSFLDTICILSLTDDYHVYQVQCHRKEEPTQTKQTSQVLCPSERMYVQS